MAKKNALGRGLGALIEDAGSIKESQIDAIKEIDINDIETNPFQPRMKFDEDSLQELAASIRELGIIQPITVREIDHGKYQLIAGERRLKASKIAGINYIPAFIRTADDQSLLEMALVENIQREDLDSIEVAISYQRLIDECDLTQENLSERIGKKRSTISNYLRLLKLPAEIQLGLREQKITMGHARAIINIEEPKTQLKIFYRIIDEELSVRKTEEVVRSVHLNTLEDPEQKNPKTVLPEQYEQLTQHLSKFFHTKIDFKINTKGVGKIVIPFKSDEELERIIAIFDKINA